MCTESVDFLRIIDEIECIDRLDHLLMAAVFGSVLLPHRQRNGIHAQAGIDIRRVGLDVVDLQAEGAHGGDKALQILAVFQLKVYLKVVGTVFEVDFKRREQRQAAHQRRIAHDGDRIQPRADGQADHAAGPERHRGRQPLDLALGAVQDGVAADGGGADDRRRRQQGGGNAKLLHQIFVDQHGAGARQAHQDEGAQTGGMPLAGAFAADDGGERQAQRQPQQHGAKPQLNAPLPQKPQGDPICFHMSLPPHKEISPLHLGLGQVLLRGLGEGCLILAHGHGGLMLRQLLLNFLNPLNEQLYVALALAGLRDLLHGGHILQPGGIGFG